MVHQIFENFKHLDVQGPLRVCPRAGRSTRSTPECIQIFLWKTKLIHTKSFLTETWNPAQFFSRKNTTTENQRTLVTWRVLVRGGFHSLLVAHELCRDFCARYDPWLKMCTGFVLWWCEPSVVLCWCERCFVLCWCARFFGVLCEPGLPDPINHVCSLTGK